MLIIKLLIKILETRRSDLLLTEVVSEGARRGGEGQKGPLRPLGFFFFDTVYSISVILLKGTRNV